MPKMYPGYRDEVRKRIVQEALAVFRTKGYTAATMEEIASRLGVTKAAIYQYFSGKPDLFAAVAEFQRQELSGILERSFRDRDMMTGAAVLFDNLVAFITRSMEIYTDVTVVAMRNEPLRTVLREDLMEDLAVIGHFIGIQKEQGRIHSSIDTRILAGACHAIINGLMHDVMIGMDAAAAKQIWLEAVGDLLRVHDQG